MLKSYWRHYTTRFQLSLLILLFFVINFFVQIVLTVIFQKLGYFVNMFFVRFKTDYELNNQLVILFKNTAHGHQAHDRVISNNHA